MKTINLQHCLVALFLTTTIWISGCQTSSAPTNTTSETSETAEYKSLAPQRVDIRGSIIASRYDQGQVMLEIEGFPSIDSRYHRAYVLVLPTTQIIGTDGSTISLSELRPGLNVAVLLRGGGRGNTVGLGIARKMWIEDVF